MFKNMNTPKPENNNSIENKLFKELLNYQEYYLIKENIIYKLIIYTKNSNIIIKCKNYKIKMNLNDLGLLTKKNFNSFDEAYEFIISLFEENKIKIKNIRFKQYLILSFLLNNQKEIEFILSYNITNKNFFLKLLIKFKNALNELKSENKRLKEEINKLKEYHICINDFKLKTDITKNSYAHDNSDNSFTSFNTINNESFLIYSTENKSIICYDIEKQKIIKEILNSHNSYITNLKHYYDKLNKRDLLLSISHEDNNIKIWNVSKNFENLINLEKVNDKGKLYSASLLYENNNQYIVSSNLNYGESENIKIFDFNANKIKEIDNSNNDTFFIETYYDNILGKNYIITGNVGFLKSYDYNNNEVFHIYSDDNKSYHTSIIIKKEEKIIKLIESCNDGNIRIWHFHTAELLNKIKISDEYIYGICLSFLHMI